MNGRDVLLFAGILSSGLSAGFFFGWVVAAIPGLARVADRTYVTAMQSINRAILNPAFFVVFFGSAVLLGAAAGVHFDAGFSTRGWWLLAATITYVVGVLAVTMGGNVPLNNQLDRFDIEAGTDEAISRQRRSYEGPWNRWHYIRTVAAVAAVSLAIVAAQVSEVA